MTKLFPIPKEKLMWYILQGYRITVDENSGTRRWYLNGRYHREDGPAVEHIDGSRRWYLNGKYLIEETAIREYRIQEREHV